MEESKKKEARKPEYQKYLINLDHVLRLMKKEGGVVMMSNHFRVPIARRRRKELASILLENGY